MIESAPDRTQIPFEELYPTLNKDKVSGVISDPNFTLYMDVVKFKESTVKPVSELTPEERELRQLVTKLHINLRNILVKKWGGGCFTAGINVVNEVVTFEK